MVRQGSSETTARIELKSGWPTAESDGGCQTAVSAVVDIAAFVLHPPSSKMFSTAAVLHHPPTAVVVAAVSSSRGGALLDPDSDDDGDEDNDDDKDNDDRSHQDCATGMWALCWGMSTITMTPMRRRSRAGLRQRRRHQRQQGGGGGQNDRGTTRRPIPEATNYAPRSSSLSMPRKQCCHRRHRRRDRG